MIEILSASERLKLCQVRICAEEAHEVTREVSCGDGQVAPWEGGCIGNALRPRPSSIKVKGVKLSSANKGFTILNYLGIHGAS